MHTFRQNITAQLKQLNSSRQEHKKLYRRGLSLILAFILLVSVMNPMFGLFIKEAKANTPTYSGNALDNSKGGEADLSWYYNAGTDAGLSEANPYIIKNADQLAGLAQMVNEGISDFRDQYIQLTGLTTAEADELRASSENLDAQPGVIDLREYNGGKTTATKPILWVPIGDTEAKPFRGTLFGADSVAVINFNYGYKSADTQPSVYGLVGYNEGTVKDFTISYTEYATTNTTAAVGLDFTTAKSIAFAGTAVAYNKATVAGISVGVGGQTYSEKDGFGYAADQLMANRMTITQNVGAAGGVAGYNMAEVTDCYVAGSISGTIKTPALTHAEYTASNEGAVGGITGVSEGNTATVRSCISKIDIIITAVNANMAFGGIAGKVFSNEATNANLVENCIASGIIQTQNSLSYGTFLSAYGGVAGYIQNSTVQQSISAMDIHIDCLSNGKRAASVGGIGGHVRSSIINECFSMGYLKSLISVGGLVGYLWKDASAITNSYSVCSIDTGARSSSNTSGVTSEITDYDTTRESHAAGGLIGYMENTTQLANIYYAGSTLKAEAGSVCGGLLNDNITNYNNFTNVFFDSQLSPNRGMGANSALTADSASDTSQSKRKNTADFSTLAGTLGAAFTNTAGGYPALAWAAGAGTTPIGILAKALSDVSTASYINSAETYGNVYRVKEGALQTVLQTPASGGQVAYTAWESVKEYTGIQDSGIHFGGIYKLPFAVTADGTDQYTLSASVQHKLLLSVNTGASAADDADLIPNAASFHRFIDVSTIASGAYIGGVFALSGDIADQVEVQPIFTVTNYQGPQKIAMMDSVFCAVLDGRGYSVSSVSFAKSGYTPSPSMLGASLSGAVRNITFTKVEMGNSFDALNNGGVYNFAYDYCGFLFSRSKATVFDTINFIDVELWLETTRASSFGLLTGRNVMGYTYQGYSTVTNIQVQNADVKIGKMSSGKNALRFGLLGGLMQFSNISNNTIQTLNLQTGLNGAVNSTNGYFQAIGSFVGEAGTGSDSSTLSYCTVAQLNAQIGGYGITNNPSNTTGFGGIVGSAKLSINNCSVSGSITAALQSNASSELMAGGIAGFLSNQKEIQRSSFTGDISGFGYVGGIVGYTNYGARITNSRVVGNIASKILENDAADGVGGFIGCLSHTGHITGSYFMGNVTGKQAGALAGYASNGTPTIRESYAKAIVSGTAPGKYIGGMIGYTAGVPSISNSYFAGQLQGNGYQGGLVGYAPNSTTAANLVNSYFDKSIAGTSVATIASISAQDDSTTNAGAVLDANSAKHSHEMVAGALNGQFEDVSGGLHYPRLKTSPGKTDESAVNTILSDLSSRKIFLMDESAGDHGTPAYLTSLPYFTESTVDDTVTVEHAGNWGDIFEPAVDSHYIPVTPGYTTATVTYADWVLSMTYDVVYKPFEYGDGTQANPYIIYSEKVLADFRDFVNSGFDTENTWYKIGSNGVDNGDKAYGAPITLDASNPILTDDNSSSWQSIVDFKGHLIGNDSVIKNLVQTVPYVAADGTKYYGFFATSSGSIENLVFDHVALTIPTDISNTDIQNTFYLGTLVGRANGGVYTGIQVLNSQQQADGILNENRISMGRGPNGAYVGGIIGYLNIQPNDTAILRKCNALFDITTPGNNTRYYAGGLVGYVNLENNTTSLLNIAGGASYGAIQGTNNTNNLFAGGIVGGYNIYDAQITMQACVSTMDITVRNINSVVGGLLGGCTGNGYASGTGAPLVNIKVLNSYYGGKLSYQPGTKAVGGLVGAMQGVYSFLDLPDADVVSTLNGSTPFQTGMFADEADLGEKFTAQFANTGIFDNSAYNYNINHVPVAALSVIRVFYKTPSGNNRYNFINRSISDTAYVFTAQSDTQEMTRANFGTDLTTDGDGITAYRWAKDLPGYYPVPDWLAGNIDLPETQQDEQYISAMAHFYSTGIYYTNADVFGDNTYSNLYLLTEPAAGVGGETLDTSAAEADVNVVVTQNGKMVQSTNNGTALVTVPLNGSYFNLYRFQKKLSFKPSVVACGVSDSSFVYANPNGMWVTTDGTTHYPWTIYTADQLQGLTSIINNTPDGNGITPGVTNYNSITASEGITGDTFALGREIDCSAYTVFDPICPGTDILPKPFDARLNGRGFTVTGLRINRTAVTNRPQPAYTVLGLFGYADGASFSNLGVANPSVVNEGKELIQLDQGVTSAGTLVGYMNDTTISNCFSALPIMGTASSATAAGGLVGTAAGASQIRNSFFTGVLYGASAGDSGPSMGGIMGAVNADRVTVSNSYVAGYIQTTGNMAVIVPEGSGTVQVNHCYYDLNAVGDLTTNNGAKAADLDNQVMSGFDRLGTQGSYPLQTGVFNVDNPIVKSAVAKVYMTNARSATSGSVTAAQYTISHIQSYSDVVSQGTIQLSADSRTFSKDKSDFTFLRVGDSVYGRLVATDLKCWYNNPSVEDGKTVYTINTAKELLEFSKIVSGTLAGGETNPNGAHIHDGSAEPADPAQNPFENCIIRLGSDIDLENLGDTWEWAAIGTPESPFKGTFDGNGHIVTLHSQEPLFDTIDNGIIRNLGLNGMITAVALEDGTVPAVTPLARRLQNNSMVSGCFSGVEITNAAIAAGLIHTVESGSSLDSCYNMGRITGDGDLAGLVLYHYGVISNSYNVGVISSSKEASVSGRAAGIALENAGSITTCFNASYLSAATGFVYAISGGAGTVSGCAYDNKLLDVIADTEQVQKGITSQFGSDAGGKWVAGDGSHYPRLSLLAGDTASTLFQTASDLSALIMQFTGVDYKEFTSAAVYGFAGGQNIQLESVTDKYDVSFEGNTYTITGKETGAENVIASIGEFRHTYFTVAASTMKIRYKFDFTGLFDGAPVSNVAYHEGAVSDVSTWRNEADIDQVISTAADFRAFIAYVNGGGKTTGRTYKLDYNIDFGGGSLPMVTGDFNGTLDGGYYTLSDFSISAGAESGALFARIGDAGRVENLVMDRVSITVPWSNAEMSGAVVAVENNGFIGNIAILDGKLDLSAATQDTVTYIGFLAAKNNGRITGCYARQVRSDGLAINHNSRSGLYNGSLVGYNKGNLSGCYFIGDVLAPISIIAGTSTGDIFNCYYAAMDNQEPSRADGAYVDENGAAVPIDHYWLTQTQMKSAEFAVWLSSNIYAGSYAVGTKEAFVGASGSTLLNDGFPYLTGFELVKYDLASYFSDRTTMLLSVWNTSLTEEESSISNGIFALDNLQFKYFSNIIMKNSLEFNMHELPGGIHYLVTDARVYGKDAQYKAYLNNPGSSILMDFTNDAPDSSLKVQAESWSQVANANLVVVTIKFAGGAASTPWGNFRSWSSTTDITAALSD